ncbi:VOC family protein [Mucilaginibacter sp. Mucisp86]|uniref:VOC family protein n=1 Tax=Mucilaginibacter sp. Mucisp86 TaxID=3243060 RepID=UPI0039B61026
MQTQVAAVTIAVKDLDAIKAFYIQKIGWQILAENERLIMLKLDNLVLTLCSELFFAEYTNISNNDGSKRFYLTINLASKTDVDRTIAQLDQAGVQIQKQPAETFGEAMPVLLPIRKVIAGRSVIIPIRRFSQSGFVRFHLEVM